MRVMRIAFATATGYPAVIGVGWGAWIGRAVLTAAFVPGRLAVPARMLAILMAAAGTTEPADAGIV
jgi:hypothetical protein